MSALASCRFRRCAMTTNAANWMCLYLPLAGGVTLCLALLIQFAVTTEFEPQIPQRIVTVIEPIKDPVIGCDCPLDTADMAPPRALYETLQRPPRMEPDKSCVFLGRIQQYEITGLNLSYLWIFEPERARRLDRLKKERDKQDKCPLIIRP